MNFSQISKYIPDNPYLQTAGKSMTADNSSSLEKEQKDWRAHVTQDLDCRSAKYKPVIKLLANMNNNAQSYLQEDVKKTGWLGKSTDFIFDVVGSDYCKEDVKDAVYQNKHDIEKLTQAAKNGSFDSEFFKMFGVSYDEKAVNDFKEIYSKNIKINVAKNKEAADKKAFDKYIKYFSEDELAKNSKKEDITKQLENFEKQLAVKVGGENNLKRIYDSQRDFGQSEISQKIDIYRNLAQNILLKDKKNVEKLTDGNSTIKLTKEYNEAYKKAFGTKNNINKKVVNYALIQDAREYVFSSLYLDLGLLGTSACVGKISPAVKSVINASSSFGMNATDIKTRTIDNCLDKNRVTTFSVNALLSFFSSIL